MPYVLKRKWWPYFLLVPLFATALFYQITYLFVVFDLRATGHFLDIPILFGGDTISAVSTEAKKAGVQAGDKLVSIDGKEMMGGRDLFRAFHYAGSNVPLRLEVVHKGTEKLEVIAVPPSPPQPPESTAELFVTGALNFVMLLCIVVGIYPAAILPRDPRALIFFGMMLATSQVITSAQWFDFPHSLQYFAFLFHTATTFLSGVWLVLFGVYFPHQFDWDLKRPWLKWIVLGPFIAVHVALLLAVTDWYFSFHRMDWLFNLLHIHSTGPFIILSFIFFFGSLSTKLRITRVRDGKRRLLVLLAGCTISLLPLGILVIYQVYSGFTPGFDKVPETLLLPVCFLFCLFPVTMAYVIVAERAMGLRMVIRQGVRYTLARTGMRVLSSAILGGLIFAFSGFLFRSKITSMAPSTEIKLKILVYAAVVIASIVLMRRARKQLTSWIDKRFFRESYHAETILEELSESVRSMVDEDEMLRTVGKRISESLHVPHFAFLMKTGEAFHPVYCLGIEVPAGTAISQDSKTVDTVKENDVPPPIYFDREDNWVYSTPETELLTLKALHSQLLLPLGSKDKLLGIISLGQKRSEEPYSRTDLQLLRSVATQTGLALENSRLTKTVATEIAQREKLNREIEIAREVQERLFPQRLPAIAGIDYSGACRPALGVGGDYYDFLTLPNGDLGVAIGDVSGKGIAAALLMASLQASLRGQALMGQGNLAQLMTNVNQLVYDATPINRYATFFYGEYHRATGLFRYVNAGHNPPFILRRTQTETTHVIRLDTGGPVVGLFPGAPYQEGSLHLQPGDIFVGFTDGISEAMNPQEEEWGEERLIPAVANYAAEDAVAIIPKLMAEADRFASGAPQHDDMTLVVVKLCQGEAAAAIAS